MTCFVTDGSGEEDGSAVDEELCGDVEVSVDGDKQVILEEACTVPCPGNRPNLPPALYLLVLDAFHNLTYLQRW